MLQRRGCEEHDLGANLECDGRGGERGGAEEAEGDKRGHDICRRLEVVRGAEGGVGVEGGKGSERTRVSDGSKCAEGGRGSEGARGSDGIRLPEGGAALPPKEENYSQASTLPLGSTPPSTKVSNP